MEIKLLIPAHMEIGLQNETVLITGSSKGLGKELSLVFAKNGYDIILHGRNEYDLEQVKKKSLRLEPIVM